MSDDELEFNLLSQGPVAMPHLPVDVVVMAEIFCCFPTYATTPIDNTHD